MPKSNEQLLREENDKLRRELGSQENRSSYEWKQARECVLPRAERDQDGKVIYDHIANPESGLIEVKARVSNQCMCANLEPTQWVLCIFMPPYCKQSQWEAEFGTSVPYPHNGYFAPTNVELDMGIDPWTNHAGYTMTEHVIGISREHRKKSYQDHYDEGERALDKVEKDKERIMEDQILDLVLPFANAPHVPGKKGGAVSLPYTSQDPGASAQKAN